MSGPRRPRAAAAGASLEVHDSTAPLAEAWDDLADRTGATPFARPGWVEAWTAAFGERGRLRVVTLRRGRRLAAVLPLLRRGGAATGTANEHTPRVELLAEDPDAARELLCGALRLSGRRLTLAPLEHDSPSHAALRAAAGGAGWRLATRTLMRSPYVAIPPGTTAADVLLGRNMRNNLRRCRRRLGEIGELTLQIERGDGDVDAAVREAVAVEARQWKAAAGTAIASTSATNAFYASVARWAASRGLLYLAVLRLDGRAIAFEIDLLDERALYALKSGFDPAHAKASPGHLLALDALDAALGHGIASYELLGDAEPYKLRWTSLCREMVQVDASAPSLAGLVDHLAVRHGGRLARAAARHRYGLSALTEARRRLDARGRA